MFVVNLLSRFMSNTSHIHLGAAKRVLKHVKGKTSYGIIFKASFEFKLLSYGDNDWVRSVNDK
ncbi:hypothetical protein REPUB_Repub04eG0179700 [Reevesia pubescens]